MRKLRTVIVDDEPLARRLLGALLADAPEIDLIAACENGREAVQVTLELQPDLLILDIQMPGINGFDVIRALQSDLMPMVIFCTAYQRYAVDAFDLHAVDYILKPVDGRRLQRAVQRAVARFRMEHASGGQKTALVGAIDEIARKVTGRSDTAESPASSEEALAADRKLAIKDHDSIVLVDTDDIDWVDAAGDYMCIHVQGTTHIMRSTLKNLMSRLDPDQFKRIHRSTLVNLERIKQVTSQPKGEYILDLDCDERLKVSRNYRDAIKTFLAQK